MSTPKLALNPKHPERICWGCDKCCSADDVRWGNGTIRTQHPVELFDDDWVEWELNANGESVQTSRNRTEENSNNCPTDGSAEPFTPIGS